MTDISSMGSIYLDTAASRANSIMNTRNSEAKGTDAFASILEKTMKTAASETALAEKDGTDTDKKPQRIEKDSKLYEQCKELETFIVKTLLDSMRKTVMKSELIDEGYAGEIYEDMLYDEYAQSMSKNAALGLADQAYLELTGQRGSVINQKV